MLLERIFCYWRVLATGLAFCIMGLGSLVLAAIAFAGVSKYPARIKCALMSWMALKDASARALSVAHPTTPSGGTA